MGSSAGGHLASTLMTHFDSGNPNATDPVERQSLAGHRHFVLSGHHDGRIHPPGFQGKFARQTPIAEAGEMLSNELQVKTNTPPCFLWTTFEDRTVPMENTLMFAEALRKNHVPFDLHIYQKGAHGMGLKDKPPFAHPHPWAGDCLFWLKAQNFVE